MKKLCFFSVCFFAVSLVASGCATAKSQKNTSKCLDQCELNLMNCLESLGCTDEGGQHIPCEEECQMECSECTQACN
jgi:hypothetical protein